MLFALTGSSGSGKTTLAAEVAERVPKLVARDTDEYGVPSTADTAWRQAELEQWIGRALAYEEQGLDVLLTGQSPLGEILAAPSAPRLAGIAVCLLDVADEVRAARLRARQPGVWSDEQLENFNLWAIWHREHAADPAAQPHIITDAGWPGMRWERWTSWTADDPRWRTYRLDTTDRSIEESAEQMEGWITEERALLQAGSSPLCRGWDGSPRGAG